MQLRGSWLDKTITLSGRYDKNVWLPSKCDAFSIRIKAALSGGIALCGKALLKLYSYLRSTSTKVAIQANAVSAYTKKAVHVDGNIAFLSVCSAVINKGLKAVGVVNISPARPLSPAVGLCSLGETGFVISSQVRASQVRPRTLGDLDGVVLSELSDWALRDFYYVEV